MIVDLSSSQNTKLMEQLSEFYIHCSEDLREVLVDSLLSVLLNAKTITPFTFIPALPPHALVPTLTQFYKAHRYDYIIQLLSQLGKYTNLEIQHLFNIGEWICQQQYSYEIWNQFRRGMFEVIDSISPTTYLSIFEQCVEKIEHHWLDKPAVFFYTALCGGLGRYPFYVVR